MHGFIFQVRVRVALGGYLDGEAGLRVLAALFTVNAVTEGADDGGVRGKGQVVVGPLPEDGHQVSVEGVAVHPRVGSFENTVGHLPYLQHNKEASDWRRCDVSPQLSSSSCAPIVRRIS